MPSHFKKKVLKSYLNVYSYYSTEKVLFLLFFINKYILLGRFFELFLKAFEN